jgi:hypothetical protein
MTPHDLTETVVRAADMVARNEARRAEAIFYMLCALLRHEADKEESRNLERRRA